MMTTSFFQKIYLTVLILLFAGTVGYGGWMVASTDKGVVDENKTTSLDTGLMNDPQACTGEQDISLPSGESLFRVTIPCDWVGEESGAEHLMDYYGFGKKGVTYRYESEYEYSGWKATPYAIDMILQTGWTEGDISSSVASIKQRYEKGVHSKYAIQVSGADATLYDYGDGSVSILIIDDRNPRPDPYGGPGSIIGVWGIGTSLYDDPEVKSVFDRILETLEFSDSNES